MASDIYLRLEGIRGEFSDSQHRDWIECERVSWRVVQPQSATSSTGGGHSAGRCYHTGVDLRKLTDVASPLLLQHCSMGKTIPSAKLEFYRADGTGERVRYMTIELTNVIVTDVAPGVYEGELMSEHVTLGYSKVKWHYIQQKISGGTNGLVVGGWDLATNRIA